eukprot:GFKZ01012760.1.p1 GENE.GFKZ01012760.1~~GFKZ01012760.1.p1  ORF type:complete len:1188 (+),score=206.21 GFKZ01012760.1:339-3902(+)
MSSSTPSQPIPTPSQHGPHPPHPTHSHVTPSVPLHPRPQLQPQQQPPPQPHHQPYQHVAPSLRRPRRDAIIARGESISLARRAAATAKKRREEARAELERRGIREGVDSALAGIVAQSASTRANVSQNKGKRSKRVKWTVDEVRALQEGVRQYGEGRWAVILREYAPCFHSCRISVDLKDKWRNLFKAHRGGGQPVEIRPLHNQQRVQTESPQMLGDVATASSQGTNYPQRANLIRQHAAFTVPTLGRSIIVPNSAEVMGDGRKKSVPSTGAANAQVNGEVPERQDLADVKKETVRLHPSDSIEFADAAHHRDGATDEVHTEHPVHHEEVDVSTHELSHEVDVQRGEHGEGVIVEEHFHQDQGSQPNAPEPNADQDTETNPGSGAGQLLEQRDVASGSRVATGAQDNVQQQLLHVDCDVQEQSGVNTRLAPGINQTDSEQHADEEQPAVDQHDTICEQDIGHEGQIVHEEHGDDEECIVHNEHVIDSGDVVRDGDLVQEVETGHEEHVHHADDVAEDGQIIQENSAEEEGNSVMHQAGKVATASPMIAVETNEGDVEFSKGTEQPLESRPVLPQTNMRHPQRMKPCRVEVLANRDPRLPPPESDCAEERRTSVCESPNSREIDSGLAAEVNECVDSDAHEEECDVQDPVTQSGEHNEHDEQAGHGNVHIIGSAQNIVGSGHGNQMDHIDHEDVAAHQPLCNEVEHVVEVEGAEHGMDEEYADEEIDEGQCEHARREQTHRSEHEYYEQQEQDHDGVHRDYEEHDETHEALEVVHYEDDDDEEHPLEPNCHEGRHYETVEHDEDGECIAKEGVNHEGHIRDLDRASRDTSVHNGEVEHEADDQAPSDNLDDRTVTNAEHPSELRRMDNPREISDDNGGVAGSAEENQGQQPNFDECDSNSFRVEAANACKVQKAEMQTQEQSQGDSIDDIKGSEKRDESIPGETREPVREVEEAGHASFGAGMANTTTTAIVEVGCKMTSDDQKEVLDQDKREAANHGITTTDNEAGNVIAKQGATTGIKNQQALQGMHEENSMQVDQQGNINGISPASRKGDVGVRRSTELKMETATMDTGLHKTVSGQESENAGEEAGQVAVGDSCNAAKIHSTIQRVGRQCEGGSGQNAEVEGSVARVEAGKRVEENSERVNVKRMRTKRQREEVGLDRSEGSRAERRQRSGSCAETEVVLQEEK